MKLLGNILTTMTLAAGLTSCGIYTKYDRPSEVLAGLDSLYRADLRPDTTHTLTSLSWEELFTDPRLQVLVRRALEANTDLQVAHLQVEEAQAALRQSKLAYLPSADLAPEASLGSLDGKKPQKTYALDVSASWEIDLFGRLTNAKREARAALLESDAYRQAVQTQVVATVADSYYALLMLDEQIDITRQTVASWEEYVRALEVLLRAGQADRATLNQARASRLAAESSLASLEQQLAEQENALCAFLGQTPRHVERGTMAEQHFPDTLCVGVPLDLLARRPDVRRAEAALMQCFYATNAARSAFYPRITLGGSAGWTNSGGASVVNPGAWLLSAVGSLVQPLFNKGENLANLQVAKARQEESLLQFRQALLDAGNEVNDALMQWQTARRRIGLDVRQAGHLEATVHDTELLMQHSAEVNYLQVITARQSLLSARLSVVQARYDEIQGVIRLYHALGGAGQSEA